MKIDFKKAAKFLDKLIPILDDMLSFNPGFPRHGNKVLCCVFCSEPISAGHSPDCIWQRLQDLDKD